MIYLLLASVIWAFSFGLIGNVLIGVDPYFLASARLVLSFLLFLPFFRPRAVNRKLLIPLFFIGVVQYGIMYMAYIASYKFLPSHQVALFTIFTPLYVAVAHDLLKRRFHAVYLLVALAAIGGAAVVRYSGQPLKSTVTGFLLLQLANICFAFGQVLYRRLLPKRDEGEIKDHSLFAILYLGAVLVTAPPALLRVFSDTPQLTTTQLWAILYLGILPSGVGFFLWNAGARKVNAGTLAALNNVKIPLAILCSLCFFKESADLPRLLIGGGIMLAAILFSEWWARRTIREPLL